MPLVDWNTLNQMWHHYPNIVAVWVFGSAKEGVVREGGDLDLGVLFHTKPSFDELLELRAELQEELHIEEIDVIPLNEASPILCFEAVCGRCLYSADDSLKASFVSLTAREYEDEMAMLEKYVHAGHSATNTLP